jgi:hypothetical protein
MREWHKSSYSGARGDCVEAMEAAQAVRIRDSKHKESGYLFFPHQRVALLSSTR